jgi:predicted nucleic acid-binding protein
VIEPNEFLDTNVLLRHFLDDHPDHSPRATALIGSIEQGQRAVRISDTVIFETVFLLHKRYGVPRHIVRDLLREFLHLPGVALPGKRMMDEVFDLFVDQPGLSFADSYHLILTRQLGIGTIIAFDQAMGRVPGIVRVEP